MDKTIHEVLCKLKVLSKLESGQNLVIGDINFQIYDSMKRWDRFLKWWLGETRYSTANKLSGFHLEIKDITTHLLKEHNKNQSHIDRLYTELHNSLRGLSNLMLTYQGDQTIGSQLELLYENFKLELEHLTPYTTENKEEKDEDEDEVDKSRPSLLESPQRMNTSFDDSMSNFYRL